MMDTLKIMREDLKQEYEEIKKIIIERKVYSLEDRIRLSNALSEAAGAYASVVFTIDNLSNLHYEG